MAFGYNFFGNQPFRAEEANNNVSVAVQNWLNTLCTHNVDAIVSLYAPDGILLGTVAKEIAEGQAAIRKYLPSEPQRKELLERVGAKKELRVL